MATPRGATEAYMDVSPMQVWDRDSWDEYDAEIDVAFHGRDVFLTPLLNYVDMNPGADTFYTANELVGSHANHNDIGLRQRYINAIYVDQRRKRLVSNKRYAGKTQIHEFDELVSRYGGGTPAFMLNVLRTRLAGHIVETHEKIARDAIFKWAEFRFLADGSAWTASTADWSTLANTTSYQMDVKFVDEVRLRALERSRKWTQRYGSWGEPIPGVPGDIMVMTTPNVMFDLWNSDEGGFMQDLRQLQDQRIINGGEARYRGATFVDNPWLVLRNGGEVGKTVGVTAAIQWGDGAPDPDTETAVDNVYYVGQSSTTVTHYVQCSAFASTDFTKGDVVTIHIAMTTDYGITDGCDIFDGKSLEAEVYEVDATNNRLKFMEPIVEEYINSFTDASAGAFGVIYAYVTRARDIHPILVVSARGMHTWAARTKIRTYFPPDDADLPGVYRATWDEYGETNRWNPYIYEVIYCVASDTRSGRAAVSLR